MNKLSNKGFTLIEVLAALAIIAILGLVAIPNVLNSINKGNQTSYDILVEDITVAGKQLFEELEYIDTTLYHYDLTGRRDTVIEITNNTITVNLQTLLSNGLITGSNNSNTNSINKNSKIITNPKTKEDIGACEITITKIVDTSNYNTSYQIKSNSSDNNCPTTSEYNKALDIPEGE